HRGDPARRPGRPARPRRRPRAAGVRSRLGAPRRRRHSPSAGRWQRPADRQPGQPARPPGRVRRLARAGLGRAADRRAEPVVRRSRPRIDDTPELRKTVYSTLIVARIRPDAQADVAAIFERFDATHMPDRMGTRRRELFHYRGLYFHLQDFDSPAGGDAIEEARTDPLFAEVARMDRAAQFAVVATREAVADSGIELSGRDPARVGVTVGTAVGATMGLEREYRTVSDDGQRYLVDHERAVPHLYQYLVPSSFAVDVAHAVGAEGPATVVSTGCTSGLDSVGYAVELIRERSADIMIAGSTDAPISPITLACFDAIKATTPRNDDAEHASRPFDISRDGFVLGEGAAMFVLED